MKTITDTYNDEARVYATPFVFGEGRVYLDVIEDPDGVRQTEVGLALTPKAAKKLGKVLRRAAKEAARVR